MAYASFFSKTTGQFATASQGSEADIALNAPVPATDFVRFDDVANPWTKQAVETAGVWSLVAKVETLAEAKARRIRELKVEGVMLATKRFPAIDNFDMLRLVQQLVTSIAPAARQPTTDITWLGQVWTAGSNAVTSVNAATTIAQVDAVTAAWPAP